MRFIMTGATGFLGQALCQELTQNGHKVTAVVRPESAEKAKGLLAEETVLLPLEEMERLKGKYDVFFHLAWNGSGGDARNDYGIQLKNLLYIEKALRAAKECGCSKFIGAGSQAEYGVVHGIAKETETVPAPFLMYGAAKLACLHMGCILAEQLGITFVWPRIYSVYGPRENDPTLLGYVARTIREGKVPELSLCENMWDFMYITDFASAMRLLAEHPESKGIYHIASGEQQKLRLFIEILRDRIAPGTALKFGAKKTDPVRTFWLKPDVSMLQRLGFECRVTFEQGIDKI